MCRSSKYFDPHESCYVVSITRQTERPPVLLVQICYLVIDLRLIGIDLDFEMPKTQRRPRFKQTHFEDLCTGSVVRLKQLALSLP
jgi:hypothetical protein